jgi:hypothetical protein
VCVACARVSVLGAGRCVGKGNGHKKTSGGQGKEGKCQSWRLSTKKRKKDSVFERACLSVEFVWRVRPELAAFQLCDWKAMCFSSRTASSIRFTCVNWHTYMHARDMCVYVYVFVCACERERTRVRK